MIHEVTACCMNPLCSLWKPKSRFILRAEVSTCVRLQQLVAKCNRTDNKKWFIFDICEKAARRMKAAQGERTGTHVRNGRVGVPDDQCSHHGGNPSSLCTRCCAPLKTFWPAEFRVRIDGGKATQVIPGLLNDKLVIT